MIAHSQFPYISPDLDLTTQVTILVMYAILYWWTLLLILRAKRFEANDKILWFLVITMAPVIGIITFHVMCPPLVRNYPPQP